MGTKLNPGKFDCYAAAKPDEPIFILLGRDPMAAVLVRLWAVSRKIFDGAPSEKADEAMKCSEEMAAYARGRTTEDERDRKGIALLEACRWLANMPLTSKSLAALYRKLL